MIGNLERTLQLAHYPAVYARQIEPSQSVSKPPLSHRDSTWCSRYIVNKTCSTMVGDPPYLSSDTGAGGCESCKLINRYLYPQIVSKPMSSDMRALSAPPPLAPRKILCCRNLLIYRLWCGSMRKDCCCFRYALAKINKSPDVIYQKSPILKSCI